jgi:fimbrial isopeptide formation D2 family protein/LPXTG-motif cell wall-anchored protein
MKNNKKYLALMTAGFLAITPMAATCMTAVAEKHTLTVIDTETANHTYTAYPIIVGTKHNDGTLTGLSWGTGINSTNLIAALKNSTNAAALGITLGESPSIDDVAEALAGITGADKIEKLAKILNDDEILGTGTGLTRSENNYSANVDDGWYLVVDSSTLDNENGPKVRSANLLQIVGNLEIDAKHSLPTLDKEIVSPNPNAAKDANTASIGDVVEYKISTKVPDTTGYNRYFFVVNDELSAGLTYNPSSIAIKVYDKDDNSLKDTLTKDANEDYKDYDTDHADYYVRTTGSTNITIVFEDVINSFENYDVGDDIVITYNATLNSGANIDPAVGNPNRAKLTYSNDPNTNYTGTPATTPDEPASGDVVGETPWDTVKTYTTAIKIKKVDTEGNVLEGAGFTLTGVSSGQALVITNSFDVSATGDYWKLKDGSFTTTDPTDSSADSTKYESTDIKYAKTTTSTLKGSGQSDVNIQAMVGTDGYIVFQGLGAGNYTLTETTVPALYNAITPIDFEISAAPTATAANWTIAGFTADTDNTYQKTIENRKGSILPTTGGIGTKLFYIIGGMLVAGSVIILVTKKRMSAKED